MAGKTHAKRASRRARGFSTSGGAGRRTSVPRREEPEQPAASAQDTGRKPSARRRVRILVVDDHPVVRQGLVRLIEQEPDLEVCSEAEDVRGGMESLARCKPDMAIVDISLKRSNGLELIRHIKARAPRVPVLVLSMHDENLFAIRVLRAGAAGYVMKQEAPTTLLTAIRRLLGGDIYVSDEVASGIVRGLARGRSQEVVPPIQLLSDRELEVFQMIGDGMATRQVAEALHLSVKTIETHRRRVMKKLGLKGATELVRHAINWVQGGGHDGTSGKLPPGKPK